MSERSRRLAFFLVVLFLCSWHLDHGMNSNTTSRAATVASLADRGTLEITPIHEVTSDKSLINGRYYSEKAPLPTFLVLPFHILALELGLIGRSEAGSFSPGLLRLGGLICGSIPLAFIITVIWCYLQERRKGLRISPALLATLPFFGSFLFVYSGSFYNHLLGALFILLGALAVQKARPMAAGLFGGAAFLSESALLLFPAIWSLQWLLARQWRFAVLSIAGVFPALILMLVYNALVTGDPWVFPNAYHVNFSIMEQAYGFGTWQPEAFWGLLVSDHRGLLFYMPFLVLGLWVLPGSYSIARLLRDPFILPALVLILAFLTHATWWGGWTYGPRYIMASAVLLAVATLKHMPQGPAMRTAFHLLCGFGILCAFAAKSTIWYSMPTEVKHPMLVEVLPRIMQGAFTEMQWTVWAGLSPLASTLLFLVVFAAGLWALVRIDARMPLL